jgi:hypothetical protein
MDELEVEDDGSFLNFFRRKKQSPGQAPLAAKSGGGGGVLGAFFGWLLDEANKAVNGSADAISTEPMLPMPAAANRESSTESYRPVNPEVIRKAQEVVSERKYQMSSPESVSRSQTPAVSLPHTEGPKR